MDPKLIIFSTATDKKTLISELAQKVSEIIKIDKEIIISEVLKREEIMPTGIANSLALPHAKINISKPVVAIALLKNEIDFDAIDGIPSRIVVLLLTPQNDNELQLKLLSEIAKTFGDKKRVDELLKDFSPDSIFSNLQKL
ncbi:MAG: PTS sugar transporter subunit IIA [Ignavibacteria bacterium]|nr:PTS sugar transporter subunit IIA [Ignavibacteria bacterium]